MNDLPNGWTRGIGEASRPLSEGGYYSHWYYRQLNGSNQHVNHRLECQIDTAGSGQNRGPTEHIITIGRYKEDGMDTWEEERLATETIEVIDPNREASQRWAAREALERARELFEEHP